MRATMQPVKVGTRALVQVARLEVWIE
jgi:hypothetical protein